MIKQVFNSTIDLKDYMCSSVKKNNPIKANPSLRLYIKVTDDCSAGCKFCANSLSKDYGKIDFIKLEYVIRYLYENKILHGISLTGGEPMINPDVVNRILNIIYSIDPLIEVQISTNGINLTKVLEFEHVNDLESIHISRHHYDENINKIIFCSSKVATEDDIMYVQEKLQDKKIININTLVIKGYIDSLKEIKEMLNYVSRLGIYKNGFVSLMKCNQYSNNNFINFNDIFNNLDENFFLSHHFYSKDYCECVDGLYLSDTSKLIEFYARMVKECNKCDGKVKQLVYTSDNRVLSGFDGKVIY